MAEHPIDRKYKYIVANKMLPKCPIATHDTTNEIFYFWTQPSRREGKDSEKKPIRVDTKEYVSITEDYYKLYKFVTLMADVIFVNGNVFTMTLARRIKCETVENITSQKSYQPSKSLNKVIKIYERSGLFICMIMMEM